MKRHWKKILILLAAVLFPLWVFGDPPVYFAKDIHGQVADAETGQMLEGVVVVASWKPCWIGSGDCGGSINTLEAVTDKEGKYFIPGWGPRLRPPLAFLDNLDPELRFFKSNYYPKREANRLFSYENHNSSVVRTSEWDGKVIKLKPFKSDDWGDYAFRVGASWSSGGSDCLRKCPRYVLALGAESERIKAAAPKVWANTSSVVIQKFPDGDREFLKRFKNEK